VSKAKIVLIAISILLLIWLIVSTPPFLSKLKLSSVNLFRIPLRIAKVSSHNIKNYIEARVYSKWVTQNRELKRELKEFSHKITRLEELEAENKRLKKLLEFKSQFPKKTVPARIIGMDLAPLAKSIVIDRGKRDGIVAGMAVIAQEGVVGKVVETNSSISRVMLLEDPDFRLGAIVQRTREQGLFVGTSCGVAKIIYLTPDSDVKVGDKIVSFPNNKMFPKGLLLGYLKDIKTENTSLYSSATVNLSVDYSRLEEVLCIK